MLLLGNHLHEKSITESQDRQSFDSVHMLFVICTYVTTCTFVATLHPFYMKNALIFSQSEVCYFFMYIILLLLLLLLLSL